MFTLYRSKIVTKVTGAAWLFWTLPLILFIDQKQLKKSLLIFRQNHRGRFLTLQDIIYAHENYFLFIGIPIAYVHDSSFQRELACLQGSDCANLKGGNLGTHSRYLQASELCILCSYTSIPLICIICFFKLSCKIRPTSPQGWLREEKLQSFTHMIPQ